MYEIKVLMYYYAILCLVIPIFASVYYTNTEGTKKKKEAKKGYPFNFLRTMFVFGIGLLTGAVMLTLLA